MDTHDDGADDMGRQLFEFRARQVLVYDYFRSLKANGPYKSGDFPFGSTPKAVYKGIALCANLIDHLKQVQNSLTASIILEEVRYERPHPCGDEQPAATGELYRLRSTPQW